MRISRKKQTKKILKFYSVNFGFEEPYRVLVDGTFIMAGLKSKVHIKEQLQKLFNGKTVPIVTDCIYKEIEYLNNTRGQEADFSGAKLIAKAYFRHKCGHIFSMEESEVRKNNRINFECESDSNKEISAVSGKNDELVDYTDKSSENVLKETGFMIQGSEESPARKVDKKLEEKKFDSFRCILDVVSKSKNSKKFIVASQDYLLRKKLSKIPGIPLLHLNRQVFVLEQPSIASNIHNSIKEESKMAPQEWEYSLIPSLKESLENNKV